MDPKTIRDNAARAIQQSLAALDRGDMQAFKDLRVRGFELLRRARQVEKTQAS